MFEKIQPNRTYHVVACQIEEAIVAERLKPDDKLPPERELMKELGVSRRTVREAFRILEQKGLIEVRAGTKGGAFVRGMTTEQVSESLALLLRLKKVSLSEVGEFRYDLEAIIAGRAAERATDEDMKRLHGLVEEAKTLLSKDILDWKAFMDVDRRMHMTLAGIAGNVIHESVLKTIHDNIHKYYESYLPRGKEVVDQNFRDMVDLVKAIEKRDAKRASTVGRKHVERGMRYMEEMAARIESFSF
jgi:GntR family transcriptional regulator, transcriptional repressor for pyruvate dehydrogenase complex